MCYSCWRYRVAGWLCFPCRRQWRLRSKCVKWEMSLCGCCFHFHPCFSEPKKTGQTPCFCTKQKQTRLAIKEDKTTYWNIWIIMETLKLKVTLQQFSLETRHTFTKNFYIASETFKLWPCFCWGQNGNPKKGSVALETGKLILSLMGYPSVQYLTLLAHISTFVWWKTVRF